MDIVTWLIVGLVAGALASLIVKESGYGILRDILIGTAGAFAGGLLFEAFGWDAPFAGLAGAITVAFVGAVLVLALLRLIGSGSRRRRRT